MAEEYDFSEEDFEKYDFFEDEKRNNAADEYISKLEGEEDRYLNNTERTQISDFRKPYNLYYKIPEEEKERIRETRKLKKQAEFIENKKEERRNDQSEYSKQTGLTTDLTEEEREAIRKKFIGGKKRKTKKNRKTKKRKTKRRKTRKHRKY
jgi:hypothetical protein